MIFQVCCLHRLHTLKEIKMQFYGFHSSKCFANAFSVAGCGQSGDISPFTVFVYKIEHSDQTIDRQSNGIKAIQLQHHTKT